MRVCYLKLYLTSFKIATALSFFFASENLERIYSMTCFHFHHFWFSLYLWKVGERAADFLWDSWSLILSNIAAFKSSFLRWELSISASLTLASFHFRSLTAFTHQFLYCYCQPKWFWTVTSFMASSLSFKFTVYSC